MTVTSDLGIAPTLEAEFDRQVATLAALDHPGLTTKHLARHVEPLRDLLPKASRNHAEAIAFLVVVRSALVPTVDAVERFEVRGKAGWTDMSGELDGYRPIEGVEVPDVPAYLLTDIDTGAATLNVTPDDALPVIRAAGRTPLTIDEGVALVTHVPAVLTARNAFQALGSRAANKRVPSFWVSKGAPRLGWCWAGNPHSWLGAASAAGRYAVG
jgi:hypothetical protein